MDKSKYYDSFTDLELRIRDFLFEIEKCEIQTEKILKSSPKKELIFITDRDKVQNIQNSYLSFLDNFLVLVDQIISDFPEGRIDNEVLAYQMSEKQSAIMSTLSNIITYQKDGNWNGVASIIREHFEIELKEWKETIENFFSI
jgi:hypothetical protein